MARKTGYKINTKFYIFTDDKGEWRWHARRNGRIVADSGEGYCSKAKLKKSLDNFLLSITSIRYQIFDTTNKW